MSLAGNIKECVLKLSFFTIEGVAIFCSIFGQKKVGKNRPFSTMQIVQLSNRQGLLQMTNIQYALIVIKTD